MLKELEKITELSLQYEFTRGNYRGDVKKLVDAIHARFATEPLLQRYNISANDSGELVIESSHFFVRDNQLGVEKITISAENLLRIAAILQEGAL